MSSSPRRAACSIISSRARSIFATSRFWCSMKSTACSTWDFCPMSGGSSKKFHVTGKRCFFRQPCRPRSSGWPPGCCASPSWWKSVCAVPRPKPLRMPFIRWRPNKNLICSWCCSNGPILTVPSFFRELHGADRIAHKLKQGNHSVAVLHSNRTQRERIEALEGFKSGKYEVMVATDIAARGLDIAGVSHVINYDVPEHSEDYVHRIGRTGRAQNVGDAFTLMNGEELASLQAIERFIGQKIPRLKLENFPYLYTALFEPESITGGRRAIGGGRSHRGYSFGRRRR